MAMKLRMLSGAIALVFLLGACAMGQGNGVGAGAQAQGQEEQDKGD
jgi:hypothetical protein